MFPVLYSEEQSEEKLKTDIENQNAYMRAAIQRGYKCIVFCFNVLGLLTDIVPYFDLLMPFDFYLVQPNLPVCC